MNQEKKKNINYNNKNWREKKNCEARGAVRRLLARRGSTRGGDRRAAYVVQFNRETTTVQRDARGRQIVSVSNVSAYTPSPRRSRQRAGARSQLFHAYGGLLIGGDGARSRAVAAAEAEAQSFFLGRFNGAWNLRLMGKTILDAWLRHAQPSATTSNTEDFSPSTTLLVDPSVSLLF